MTLKNNGTPRLSHIELNASFHHHIWIQTGVTVRKFGFDLCDLVLRPLTLNFCMDITSVIGNNYWKLHDDTMMGAKWKRGGGRQRDRQTYRRTDRRTDRLNHSYSQTFRSAIEWLEYAFVGGYVFISNGASWVYDIMLEGQTKFLEISHCYITFAVIIFEQNYLPWIIDKDEICIWG